MLGIDITNTWVRLIFLPVIPILFAYLEQGGNLYAQLTIAKPTLRNFVVTFFFSVIYSFVAAYVSIVLDVSLALMMINYGFGFSAISLLLDLEWNKLPHFTLHRIRANPNLRIPLGIAILGSVTSAYFVVFA